MPSVSNCIFCQIAQAQMPAYKIFENEAYLGFLNIFPNTEGFSVVIPKSHYESDFVKAPQTVVHDLVSASRLVAQKICQAYDNLDRCALVFEGMMVDHLHTKIIPLHETVDQSRRRQDLPLYATYFFKSYQGFISTQQPKKMASAKLLEQIANKINQT